MTAQDEERSFATATEAAPILRLSPRQVRSLIRKGEAFFPGERVGSRYHIPREFLDITASSGRGSVTMFRRHVRRIREGTTPFVDRDMMSLLRNPAWRRDLLAQAEVAARLSKGSSDHTLWQQAYDSLLDAWMAVGLSRSGRVDLSGRADHPALIGTLVSAADRPTAIEWSERSEWVSKTDLTRYVRCPYAFWLLDRGEIAFNETVDDFQRRLLEAGNEFQRLVETRATRIHAEAHDLPLLLHEEAMLVGATEFRNEALRILGQPDGVDTGQGELLPVEIKSHRHVQRTDELELAFYWLLLEPYRDGAVENPRGYLILRRDGEPEKVEVPIRPERLEEVRRLLDQVRETRRHGARPRICSCVVCSQLRRDEVLQVTWDRKDLSLIVGIGRGYADALEAQGIGDYEALLDRDPGDVVAALRERRCFVSAATVEQWQRHAESWTSQAPVYFGEPLHLAADAYIVLDLEYDQTGLLWLIGTCRVSGEERSYTAYWADDWDAERRNLLQLEADLAEHAELPILTWSGVAADLPRIRAAATRADLDHVVAEIDRRHCDLYGYALRSVRLPITSLSLKDVADYYAVPKVSAIRDGAEADTLYLDYRFETYTARRETLRQQLIDYNRDDLDAVVAVTESFLHRGARVL